MIHLPWTLVRRIAGAALWLAAGLALAAPLPAAAAAAKAEGSSYGDLKEVTLQGKVISLADELSRKYGARVTGGGAEKQWGLALPEGQIYTFLENDRYRELVAAKLAGKAVEVKARQFPRSMLLEILSFKPIPAEAIRRRFYCGVCAIHTDDFGPCACCGAEMQVVRDAP